MRYTNNIKISIVIPTYNSAETIERCISSVFSQTYSNFEIIVVDDGSSDDTLMLLEKQTDSRLKIFQCNHSGVSHARNYGLSKCRGEYILFLDSDDTIKKDALLKLYIYMTGDRNVDLIKFGYSTIKNGDRCDCSEIGDLASRVFHTTDKNDKEELLDLFFRNKKTIPCYSVTLFFKKSFLDNNSLVFNKKLCMMEDAVFYLDIFEHDASILFIPDSLYNYYIYPQSTTQSKSNSDRIAGGAIDSCTIILNKLGFPLVASNKYFKMIFGYIAKSFSVHKTLCDTAFGKKYSAIAIATDFSNDKLFWKLAKIGILNNNHAIIKLLARLYMIKEKIGA